VQSWHPLKKREKKKKENKEEKKREEIRKKEKYGTCQLQQGRGPGWKMLPAC